VAVVFYGAVQKIVKETVTALEADGLSVALINARFCKPLDLDLLGKYGQIAKVVCTIEDHVLMGGFGSAVLEAYADRHITTPVVRIGWPDQFIEHATTNQDLQDKYGLNSKTAVTKVKAALADARAATPQQFRLVANTDARSA
jgi:1-deoxy-D-xylulose-5-phosphate synthase